MSRRCGLLASIPNHITGTVQIVISLADDAAEEALALAELVTTWVHAVEVGFFGVGSISQQRVETRDHMLSGWLECEQVSQAAFCMLSRMVQHSSEGKGGINDIIIFRKDGQRLLTESGAEFPNLPRSIPFVVEYPEDLRTFVRVEIEFRDPLTLSEQTAVFRALSIWDMLVDVLADQQRRGKEIKVRYATCMLHPAIVEHEVFGYFASLECLNFIVWLGLRLHQRLFIERITFE